MKYFCSAAIASIVFFGIPLWAADKVDFHHEVKPILEATCVSCHGPERPKGRLRLDSREAAIKGGDLGTSLVPGKPEESPLYTTTILPEEDPDVMPPKELLTREQTEVLRRWILEGAEWPEDILLTAVPRINFIKDVQPILEMHCVACHREDYVKGKYRMDTREMAFQPGDIGEPPIVPGFPEKSWVYTSTVLPAADPDLMPPVKDGGPLPKEVTDILRDWISQGAVWPEGVTLVPRKAEEIAVDTMAIAQEIHKKIVARTERDGIRTEAQMKAYSETIPGTMVQFHMVPIPGGEFLMGSPEAESARQPDEDPQIRVKINPFWMGQYEVTWNEFELFMYPDMGQSPPAGDPSHLYSGEVADAVTRPTKPYVEMSFGMGKDGFPAISMTQHAANKFCEWLSARTGQFYRLPTEAEWEYACRAGTTTAYYFGDDPEQIEEYAWFEDNSDWKYQKVGRKKPNPWGLHDMHGNVAEWTLDQYDANFYRQFAGKVADNPWNKASKPYPHSVRGGSWNDPPELLRSAARLGSDRSWKMQDPQLPKSIWYHTDALYVGMRLVRPLEVPTAEEMHDYWNSGVEKD
jgi:formylglycine-generating enzyme required for sulfatase activity